MQGEAAKDAAAAQAGAAANASAVSQAQYEQTRKDQEPWRQAGGNALGLIQNPEYQKNFSMADFAKDPGYDFRLAEGNKAIERAANSRGSSQSGATLKALTKYGQDYASGEYQNAYTRFNADRDRTFNRLASVAGLGQTANTTVANAGMNNANNISNNILATGNAQAAGTIGQAQAYGNAVNQGMNTWMNYQMMNKYAPKTA
jgi:hypothetical protein